MDELIVPKKDGWYWVLITGYDKPTPCWFYMDEKYPDEWYFLPAGMGDSSSMGLYADDIERVGPEIIAPKF